MEITGTTPRLNAKIGTYASEGVDPAWSVIRRVELADDLGDELMASASPDGRPPKHHARVSAWRAAAIVGPALAVLLALWLIVRGTHGHDMLWLGVAFLIVAPLSAWPVLAAGVWRGKEERVAMREARADLGVAPGTDSPQDQ